MAKHKHALPAVTRAAKEAGQVALHGLAGAALTALQHDAARVVAGLAEIQPERSLQLVSTENTFHAVIRHGKTTIQCEDGKFAVSTHD